MAKTPEEQAKEIAKQRESLKEISDQINENTKNAEHSYEQDKATNELKKDRIKLELQILDSLREQGKVDDKIYLKLKEKYDFQLKELQAYKEVLEETRKVNIELDGWVQKLTGGVSILKGSFKLASIDIGNQWKSIARDFSVLDTLGNVGVKGLQTFIKSSKELLFDTDKMLANFNEMTAAGGDYDREMVAASRTHLALGVNIGNIGLSYQSLFRDMAAFTSLSEDERTKTATLAATITKLGVSIGDFAKVQDFATKALGRTASGARDLQLQLTKTAIDLKLPPNEVTKAFAAAAPQLANYGDQMVDVFKNMTAAGKAFGVSAQELIGIAAQFDTFEGAANAAGRLNAVLGGGLINSIDLLTADADEKIRLVLQAFEASGQSWQDLDRFHRSAIMSAAGINDMATANKVFGGGLDVWDAQKAKMDSLALSEEELTKRSEAAQTISENWKQTLSAMGLVFEPVIKGLRDAANWIAKMSQGHEKLTAGIVLGGSVLLIAGAMWLKAGIAAKIAAAGISTIGAASGAATPAVAGLSAAAAPFIPVAWAMVGVAVALAAAIFGIGFVVKQLAPVVMSFFNLVSNYINAIRDVIVTAINGIVKIIELFRGGSANTTANAEALTKFYSALGSPTNVRMMNAALDESAKKVENLASAFNKVSIPNVSAMTNMVTAAATSAPAGGASSTVPNITLKILLDGKELDARIKEVTYNGVVKGY